MTRITSVAALLVGFALAALAGCGGDPEAGERPAASPAASSDATPAAAADPPRTTMDGVTIAGRVVAEESGEPIPAAYVVILKPGVAFERWEAAAGEETGSLIEAAVRADSTGAYRIPGIDRGHDYTVIIAARRFKSAAFDLGLTVEDTAPAVVRMDPVALETAVW